MPVAEKAGGLLALEHPLAVHPALFFVVYAGLPHGLITFATLGLMTGIPAKVVSEHLGHSSGTITLTLDTYSHVLPNMQDELAIEVENLLKRC